jgi:hypothetical protein
MDEKFGASPVYQWTIEKDIAIGKAQMLTQIRQKAMQIVFERFLSLASLAGGVVAMINNPSSLLSLIVNLAQAQSTEEAEQILLKAQAVG